MIDHEIYILEMYGILPNYRQSYLETVIDKMIENDLIEIEMVSKYHNLPTLRITQKGRDYLDDQYIAEIKFVQELSDKEVILLNDEEQELFEELRAKRRELSEENSIPGYMVCSTISLRELAKSKPMNETEMLAVKGVGGMFFQRYGEDFLNTIRSFSREKEQITILKTN